MNTKKAKEEYICKYSVFPNNFFVCGDCGEIVYDYGILLPLRRIVCGKCFEANYTVNECGCVEELFPPHKLIEESEAVEVPVESFDCPWCKLRYYGYTIITPQKEMVCGNCYFQIKNGLLPKKRG